MISLPVIVRGFPATIATYGVAAEETVLAGKIRQTARQLGARIGLAYTAGSTFFIDSGRVTTGLTTINLLFISIIAAVYDAGGLWRGRRSRLWDNRLHRYCLFNLWGL